MKISPWFAVAALLVIAGMALPEQPAPPAGNESGTITDSTGNDRAFSEASCDTNDNAFNVLPDTPAAYDAAQAWCESSGRWIDNAPWPSGLKPVPLDDALHP